MCSCAEAGRHIPPGQHLKGDRILKNFQDKADKQIEIVQEEVSTVRKKVQARVQEVEEEIGTVRDEIDKKVQDLEQRIMKKTTEECPGNEYKMPIHDNKLCVLLSHRHHKPPTFDGEASWSMYKRQFEAATTNGWDEQQKATELVLALRGKALQTLQDIPEEKQNDYFTVVGALELRFGSKYLSQVYQNQLKSRSQGPTETLQEFSTDIERMVRLAYPEAPEEFIKQLNIQSFIDGVKDPELQQALRLGRFKTLSEAVIYGLEFEAAKNVSDEINTHQLLKGMMTLLEKLTNSDNKQAFRNSRQLKCFGCEKIGHIQKNCRRRSNSEERNKETKSKESATENSRSGNAPLSV
ncbi:hypothetical protein NQ315_013994 [Exocentrus adspersus]|uniref:CCHC-type domain-containing protein n=1 Tax=Exocentrus adspersus TaxID=1586481 RepID=A0AAV8VHN9_9CUCU|nr:hypothetical protein NQ315_013994 [Exocentrus adspersus]